MTPFTLGTMRALDSPAQMVAVLAAALAAGIRHVETAPAYGPAEAFLGEALQRLERRDPVLRRELVLTSKLLPGCSLEQGQGQLHALLARLAIPRLDNLAVHGLNTPEHLDWALRGEGRALLDWAEAEGLVGQVGFSSHGATPLIEQALTSGRFSFCSLHLHLFDPERLPLARAALAEGIGVMAISPADKGGRLYDPPAELLADCAPFHPLELAYRFLLDQGISTLTLGAAQPGDLAWAAALGAGPGGEAGCGRASPAESGAKGSAAPGGPAAAAAADPLEAAALQGQLLPPEPRSAAAAVPDGVPEPQASGPLSQRASVPSPVAAGSPSTTAAIPPTATVGLQPAAGQASTAAVPALPAAPGGQAPVQTRPLAVVPLPSAPGASDHLASGPAVCSVPGVPVDGLCSAPPAQAPAAVVAPDPGPPAGVCSGDSGAGDPSPCLPMAAAASLAEPWLSPVHRAALARLEAAGRARLAESRCGQCRQCLPCPNDVPIPALLRLRNLAVGHGMVPFASERYSLIGRAGHWWEQVDASACQRCGDCLPRCPLQLPIPDLLADTHRRLAAPPRRRLWG